MTKSSNNRIAKNTLLLYFRTFVVMLVMLYTSRVVLQVLGVEDLGIYNLVGSIVALMGFIQSVQSRATSRFITYKLGQGSTEEEQSKIFAACSTIHIIIALAILFISETIGLWVVNNLTKIPIERMFAANVVYQFSVLTFIVNLIRTPYDSVIIAHEKMSMYAYMSIGEVILLLMVALSLKVPFTDKLILYGFLHWVVSLLLYIIYMIYTTRIFKYYRFGWLWEKETSLDILSFSGWTLFGTTANTISQQGVSLLLNNFVGLVVNTSLGFANQVNGALIRFISSFTTAFNPQIIKLYASRDLKSMYILIIRASKFSFFLSYIVAVPLIINMDFILNIWLTTVPQYTIDFCKLILVCSVIDATTGVFYTSINATGNIKFFQIGISFSFLLDVVCVYILLVLNFHPALVFGSRIVTRGMINMLIELYFVKKQIDLNLYSYFRKVIVPIILTVLLTIPLLYYACTLFVGLQQLLITSSLCLILSSICLFFVIMDVQERKRVFCVIKNRFYEKFKIEI